MYDPRHSLMGAVYCNLRHLKSPLGRGFLFAQHDHLSIEGYTDSD